MCLNIGLPSMDSQQTKSLVREHWDAVPCGTQDTVQTRYSLEYFEEIERVRYDLEPFIFSFAQFTRHHGERLLEVGTGAGTDFLQWVRAGARATGLDLTPNGIEHVQRRLDLYGLTAGELIVGDSEALLVADCHFD